MPPRNVGALPERDAGRDRHDQWAARPVYLLAGFYTIWLSNESQDRLVARPFRRCR